MIIKEQPEDFYVKELMEPAISNGPFSYFLMRKRNIGTFEAIQKIAQALHLPMKCIGYAGVKDKRAVTEQYISIYKTSKENAERISLSSIELKYIGTGKERISLGDHTGNYFKIVVRDVDKKKTLTIDKVKNLFDSQRFGTTGKNYLIGKAIIQGKFADACRLLELDGSKDPIRVLRNVDLHMLRFYISAYQAYLWNTIASQADGVETLPLVGFLTELDNSIAGVSYKHLLKKEGIDTRDFLIPKMPELGNEGAERKMYAMVTNFSAQWSDDEIHKGKHKATLSFQLPKGAYATQVVKTLFSDG